MESLIKNQFSPLANAKKPKETLLKNEEILADSSDPFDPYYDELNVLTFKRCLTRLQTNYQEERKHLA